jgi:hypothetical protein
VPGSLLVSLASDAGVPRPKPQRVQPRAPEPGLAVIRALILEGHGLQRTALLRPQWVSVNLTVGASTVSTRRVQLQTEADPSYGDTDTAHVQWDELLELVIDCPKDQQGQLRPPDAFLELMLGGKHGEQKRLSYTRVDASELLQWTPDCMVYESLSREQYQDKVLGASFIPWTDYALGVRCTSAKNLRKTDRLANPDYYVRITLYSGPEADMPSPAEIRENKQYPSLAYSDPPRTQDAELNKENVAVWDEIFRFGTPHDEGHYEMPFAGDDAFVIVDVFDEVRKTGFLRHF